MSTRLNQIKKYVDQLISTLPSPTGHHMDDDNIQNHLYGVSSCCVLLAMGRGLDPEIAAASGLLHDIYRFETGISLNHGHNGAEMARVALKRMDEAFCGKEKQLLLSAIFHHTEKSRIHGEYDELLKDADTLSPILYEGGIQYASPGLMQGDRRKRLKKVAKELKLSIKLPPKTAYVKKNKTTSTPNKRLLMADIAEELAASAIVGTPSDPVFINLIRYWPEDTAVDELKNAWCAGFVYHCCQEAGFILPIKWLTEGSRFAGVAAWNTWARRLGYFIKDKPGVIPKRGDIVLYRNSIPPENKREEWLNIPIDHIGIVLSGDSEGFTAAEGNVNNQNISGILTRPLNQNIEGYIRIENGFAYSDWKFDYKKLKGHKK